MSSIAAIKMPKWGLSMQEGAVLHWWKAPGDLITEGEELVDIETSKITNAVESTASGVLRRIVAAPNETLPVGALLAVVSDADVPAEEIDRFIEAFQASFVPAESVEVEGALKLRTVAVSGGAIQVGTTAGAGTPIVLLHGFAADLNNWLFNIDALQAGGPVVALDLPGHGASTKDVGEGSLRSLAERVAEALDRLGIEHAHLIGHSLGAAVAAQVALLRPGLARSLILVAPAHLPGTRISEAFLSGIVEAQGNRQLKAALAALVADPGLISKDMVDGVMRFKRLDGAEAALGLLRDRMIEGADFRALQARMGELPDALVIAGRGDRIVGAPDASALPATWRVAWIDGAGHMPHLEKSAEVNALILDTVNAANRR